MSRRSRKKAGAPWYVSQKDAWKDNEDKQIRNLEKNLELKSIRYEENKENTSGPRRRLDR
jgi:hypothetical protein